MEREKQRKNIKKKLIQNNLNSKKHTLFLSPKSNLIYLHMEEDLKMIAFLPRIRRN